MASSHSRSIYNPKYDGHSTLQARSATNTGEDVDMFQHYLSILNEATSERNPRSIYNPAYEGHAFPMEIPVIADGHRDTSSDSDSDASSRDPSSSIELYTSAYESDVDESSESNDESSSVSSGNSGSRSSVNFNSGSSYESELDILSDYEDVDTDSVGSECLTCSRPNCAGHCADGASSSSNTSSSNDSEAESTESETESSSQESNSSCDSDIRSEDSDCSSQDSDCSISQDSDCSSQQSGNSSQDTDTFNKVSENNSRRLNYGENFDFYNQENEVKKVVLPAMNSTMVGKNNAENLAPVQLEKTPKLRLINNKPSFASEDYPLNNLTKLKEDEIQLIDNNKEPEFFHTEQKRCKHYDSSAKHVDLECMASNLQVLEEWSAQESCLLDLVAAAEDARVNCYILSDLFGIEPFESSWLEQRFSGGGACAERRPPSCTA